MNYDFDVDVYESMGANVYRVSASTSYDNQVMVWPEDTMTGRSFLHTSITSDANAQSSGMLNPSSNPNLTRQPASVAEMLGLGLGGFPLSFLSSGITTTPRQQATVSQQLAVASTLLGQHQPQSPREQLQSTSGLGQSGVSSAAASTSGSTPIKEKLTCAVCGDTALGKHYGVMACNGCKGFFRRSVWKKRTYKCRVANQCAIDTEQRNACRACRLTACLRVGMNPRAVQGDLNECRKNGVICPTKSEPIDSDEEDDETEMLCVETQTDLSALAANDDLDARHALPEGVLEVLRRFRSICSRTDETPPGAKTIAAREKVPFERIFYKPELITSRTPLDPSAGRVASLDDILQDYRRAFVLYADMMHKMPEFLALHEEDRMRAAKSRFGHFYWWMTGIWSMHSHCKGICYANGSYFPADATLQNFPDSRGCASRATQNLNERMATLNLTETERAVGAHLCIFADDVVDMSPEGRVIWRAAREQFLLMMHNVVGGSQTNEYLVALRVGTILAILPHITDLVLRSCDNVEISDVLQIAQFDEWCNPLITECRR